MSISMKGRPPRIALYALAFTLSPASVLAAESRDESPQSHDDGAPTESARTTEDRGHGGQFSLRAGLVAGYRVVFRYDESPLCRDPRDDTDDPQRLCGFTAPLGLDLALGFAPLDVVEPYLWARLGLGSEDETDTRALRVLGAGVRIYTRSADALKVFIEPAVGVEIEGGQGTDRYQFDDVSYGNDLVFHIAAGPHYDFSENVGMYLGAGLTAGILRAIHTNMELQFGFQGRY